MAQQRFFAKSHYVPKVHSYAMMVPGGTKFVQQEERATIYIRMLNLERGYDDGIVKCREHHCHREKLSLKATKQSMINRPVGGELLKTIMQPGDYLVVDDAHTIFTKEEDLEAMLRRFEERNQHLHILNFHGAAVDCDSPAGQLLMGNFKLIHAFNRSYRQRIYRIARGRAARVSKRKKSDVPFFCEIIEKDGQQVMVLKDWALAAAELITWHYEVGPSWGRRPPFIAKKLNDSGLGVGWHKTYTNYQFLYYFKKAWEEAGKPDVNELKFPEFVHDYRVRLNCNITHIPGESDVREEADV